MLDMALCPIQLGVRVICWESGTSIFGILYLLKHY
uniref:Uncharacterized protein n=1 Tax=Arundo donax TaxID=35708 RepID=A0A0A9ERF1_ARUDO